MPVRTAGTDKWTGFLLSLAVPGAGQLLRRHPTCLLWFAAAAVTMAVCSWAGAAAWTALALAPLALLSAEHAKRLAEFRLPAAERTSAAPRVACGHRGRAVDLVIELHLARPPAEVWTQVADLPTFLCIDPFHDRVRLPAAEPAVGMPIALEHCAFGVRLTRIGRILRFRAGREYAFSDLSQRGPRAGFPHVFIVTVTPGPAGSVLTVRVRGRWTARWVPMPIARFWLTHVCREHARLLRQAL